MIKPATQEEARKAKEASRKLARLSTHEKNLALREMARALQRETERILAANQTDLENASPLVESRKMSKALYDRLKLEPTKIRDMVEGVRQVEALPDPVGRITLARELDDGLELYRVTCPLGVVGVIFESRPDALVQIAALCLKSGNAVILKGGSEAEHSNKTLHAILADAVVRAGLPQHAMVLLESREEVESILKAEGMVDLIVPRGSNQLVRTIQDHTNIPVLGHAEGICHLYVDRSADLKKALAIVLDAKIQYPAACNAAETLLVHREVAAKFLPEVVGKLAENGVEVRGDRRSLGFLESNPRVKEAAEEDWKTEYGDLILSVKTVDSIEEAIAHINRYGSRHTDAIVTEDPNAFEQFFSEVDSANVYLNASTRFSDGFRYGFGAEVGISTGKLHPRGPVGLEGLITYKYKLVGQGHVVADYSGPTARPFRHKPVQP